MSLSKDLTDSFRERMEQRNVCSANSHVGARTSTCGLLPAPLDERRHASAGMPKVSVLQIQHTPWHADHDLRPLDRADLLHLVDSTEHGNTTHSTSAESASYICSASSHVGARTSTCRLLPALLDERRRASAGRPKASVLPLPVSAMPTTSFPESAGGYAQAWMGVGSLKVSAKGGPVLEALDETAPAVTSLLLDVCWLHICYSYNAFGINR